MAARRGVTFRKRQLGTELERLREQAGLTQDGAVDKVIEATGGGNRSSLKSKVSRVESGLSGIRLFELEHLLDAYGVDDKEHRQLLIGLQREATSRNPWTPFKHVMPSGMPIYVDLEQDARIMRAWQQNVVFGLLQTEDYAQSLFNMAKPVDERTTQWVERNTRIRMERKDVLTQDNPLRLWVILAESALRRMMGTAKIMREQCEEIIRLTELENVTIRIIPDQAHTYRCGDNFVLLDFDEGLDSLVEMDTSKTVTVMDNRDDVWLFGQRFDAMRDGALPKAETPNFIDRLMREVWSD